ncbi:BnaCnng37730D [Brassica napus]|uniref:BnaCnng37730D protein n=1 Tax=Brassica napus TaxID=3708 RepID=A0A078J509_BRANA|nr:BnaCnng37730D [Brassica napus]
MANSQVLLADLKAGHCSNVAEVWLLRFWEARNVRKGGELTIVNMLFVDENSSRKGLLVSYPHSAFTNVMRIEDVHPNGGIKKFKSSVYSNFVFSFRLRSKLVPQSNRSQSHALIQQDEMNLSANRFQRLREVARGHLSRLQGIWSLCSDQVAVGLKTHSCCMCDRALSPVSLSTPIKTSSSSHLSESGSKAADPVGTSPEPTTKKPMRCTNLE